MKNISLDITKAEQFLETGTLAAFEPKVVAASESLENGTCRAMTSWDGFTCRQTSHRIP